MTNESFNIAFAIDFINEDYLPNKKFGYLEHIKPICFEELCRIEDIKPIYGWNTQLGWKVREIYKEIMNNIYIFSKNLYGYDFYKAGENQKVQELINSKIEEATKIINLRKSSLKEYRGEFNLLNRYYKNANYSFPSFEELQKEKETKSVKYRPLHRENTKLKKIKARDEYIFWSSYTLLVLDRIIDSINTNALKLSTGYMFDLSPLLIKLDKLRTDGLLTKAEENALAGGKSSSTAHKRQQDLAQRLFDDNKEHIESLSKKDAKRFLSALLKKHLYHDVTGNVKVLSIRTRQRYAINLLKTGKVNQKN